MRRQEDQKPKVVCALHSKSEIALGGVSVSINKQPGLTDEIKSLWSDFFLWVIWHLFSSPRYDFKLAKAQCVNYIHHRLQCPTCGPRKSHGASPKPLPFQPPWWSWPHCGWGCFKVEVADWLPFGILRDAQLLRSESHFIVCTYILELSAFFFLMKMEYHSSHSKRCPSGGTQGQSPTRS